jgi:hypothetical protein
MTNNVVILADSLEWMQQTDIRFQLVIGSPPYANKMRRYKKESEQYKIDRWIEWMCNITKAAISITNGYVVWVVNGYVESGRYHPACEGLVYRLYKDGILCERPNI